MVHKDKQAIIVSGTPGTGKTTLSKEISSRFNLAYVDVNEIIKENKLSEGFDEKRNCEIIDTDKLNEILIEQIRNSDKLLVIDSHLSHYLPKMYVKLCIITKCDLGELKKRLLKRGYSEDKIRENLDSDIFDVCLTDAQEFGHNVYVVETDKEIDYGSLEKNIFEN
jgi:adenylate kinase